MGKALGSFSGMRKYLEKEMLAEKLDGRIRFGCTTYAGMDGCHIFDVSIDGKQVKRFSLETVNSFFIGNGLIKKEKPMDKREYWDGFWYLLNEIPIEARTEYTDGEFCQALECYRNQDIKESLSLANPIVRMFAVLDRRVGKRTLLIIKETIEEQPLWLKQFYQLRCSVEGV